VKPAPRLGLPLRHPAVLLATWFGVGFLPVGPGSWGSLTALPLAWAICTVAGKLGLAIAALALIGLGAWAAQVVIARCGLQDPGAIVVDEVAGQWLVLLAAPPTLPAYALAFVLFRLFDILKPWPVGWADRSVCGGFGIMLDDLLAAVYALLVLFAIEGLTGVRQ
jgi:phosphatidylglycerophosphatase A